MKLYFISTLMIDTPILLKIELWLLIAFSILIPIAIVAYLMLRRQLSKTTIFILGFVLVMLAGIDVVSLQALGALSKKTPTLLDDQLFSSEYSFAFYILPLLAAGIGVNIISHVITEYLVIAEIENEKQKSQILTIEAVIDSHGVIHLAQPVRLPTARRALVTLFKEEATPYPSQTMLPSKPGLAADWHRPQEDAAWSYSTQTP